MSDVIRDTEEKDGSNLLTTHIFITQFYEKFDLRTTMLVCIDFLWGIPISFDNSFNQLTKQ